MLANIEKLPIMKKTILLTLAGFSFSLLGHAGVAAESDVENELAAAAPNL